MSPRAGFILEQEVVPRLISAIPNNVKCIGSEDVQELVQDSIAMAAKLMHNAEKAKKKVTPGNIAYYTIQHMRSGRRSTGSSVVDVLHPGTQLKGKTRISSMDEVVAFDDEGGEIFTFNDVLSNDQEDPSTKAAQRLDWKEFVNQLSEKEKAALKFMVQGFNLRAIGRFLNWSDSTLQTTKNHLAVKIREFMGTDILIEIKRSPRWRIKLEATKEKLACRYERNH